MWACLQAGLGLDQPGPGPARAWTSPGLACKPRSSSSISSGLHSHAASALCSQSKKPWIESTFSKRECVYILPVSKDPHRYVPCRPALLCLCWSPWPRSNSPALSQQGPAAAEAFSLSVCPATAALTGNVQSACFCTHQHVCSCSLSDGIPLVVLLPFGSGSSGGPMASASWSFSCLSWLLFT